MPDHAPVHRFGQRLQLSQTIPSQQAREGSTKSFTGIQGSDIHTTDTQELPGRWRNILKTQGKKCSESQTSLEGGGGCSLSRFGVLTWALSQVAQGWARASLWDGHGHLSRGLWLCRQHQDAGEDRRWRWQCLGMPAQAGAADKDPDNKGEAKSRLIEAAPSGRPGFQKPGHAVMSASAALRWAHN